MKSLAAITDPIYIKPETYSRADRFFLKLLRDERDLPFIHLTLLISFILIPMAVVLYTPLLHGWYWAALAAVYVGLLVGRFIGPFALMFHCTCHRIFFKKEYEYLNHYLPWVLSVFMGHSPQTYYSHHIGMHHAENNLEDDDSSTMPYQRDSLPGFLHYFGAFFFKGIYDLTVYLRMKNRPKLRTRVMRGEGLFILFCIGMCFVSVKATLLIFVLPIVLYRLIAMLGNWAQHAFIDAADPGNSYKNSTTCINVKYNHLCWNDGYHISHHVKQAMHWSEHPVYFQQTLDQYVSNESIVFDNIDFLQVWLFLMLKRYDLLAKNFVDIDGVYSSDAEIIALLKERVKPIKRTIITEPLTQGKKFPKAELVG